MFFMRGKTGDEQVACTAIDRGTLKRGTAGIRCDNRGYGSAGGHHFAPRITPAGREGMSDFIIPRFMTGASDRKARSSAILRPFCVMIQTSPDATSRRSSEKRNLASYAAMTFMYRKMARPFRPVDLSGRPSLPLRPAQVVPAMAVAGWVARTECSGGAERRREEGQSMEGAQGGMLCGRAVKGVSG